MPTPRTLIAVQDMYILSVDAALARWSHRKNGGHSHRTIAKAGALARKRLAILGYTEQQARQIVRDAYDMAVLERCAE